MKLYHINSGSVLQVKKVNKSGSIVYVVIEPSTNVEYIRIGQRGVTSALRLDSFIIISE